MSEPSIKGLATGSIRKWTRRHYGEALYEQVLASLPREHREALDQAWVTSWVPVSAIDQLWAGTAEAVGLSPAELERDFLAQGHFVANDNLAGVLRSILTFFINPKQLFNYIPKLWAIYFRGANVEIRLDPDELGGLVRVSGLGDVRYLGVIVCGWCEKAFGDVGTKSLQVTERAYRNGDVASDPLVFDMRWTV